MNNWISIIGISFLATGIVSEGVAALGLATFDFHYWLYGPGTAFMYGGVTFAGIGAASFLIGNLLTALRKPK